MRICLPLAHSLVLGQSIRCLPFDCAPGTRLGGQMSPLRQLRVPAQALDPCGWAHRISFDPPAAANKNGWVGCYPSCQNLCPKSTKPRTCSGSSTRANIFMQLFVGSDFQIKFHEQSFNTAAFKKQMRRSIYITEVYLAVNLL